MASSQTDRDVKDLVDLLRSCFTKDDDDGAILFRPAIHRSSSEDAFWDAVEIATQYLLQRGLKLWFSLMLSRQIADENIELLLNETALADSTVVYIDSEQTDTLIDQNALTTHRGDDCAKEKLGRRTFLVNGAPFCKSVVSLVSAKCEALIGDSNLLPAKPTFSHEYSVFSAKNQRRKMEDKHTIVPALSLLFPDIAQTTDAFFAVYDGHVGAECAVYAGTHLLPLLVASPHFAEDPPAAFRDAFLETDRRLAAKCEREHIRSGCTAVCALTRGSQLHVAWAGDSAAGLLSAVAGFRPLTEPHSPDQEKEYKRIEEAGGAVLCVQGELRIGGMLNVSRSLGDVSLKPSIVSAEPDLVEVDLSAGSYDLLILACDGVWDALDGEEFAECVSHFVRTHPVQDHRRLAECLADRAKTNGSTDNLTAIVVFLKPPDTIWDLFK